MVMPVISIRLPVGAPKASVSPWWVPRALKQHYDLVPFGHHILYGVLKVGKGLTVSGGELLGPFYASCFAASRLIADVVRVDDLLGCEGFRYG